MSVQKGDVWPHRRPNLRGLGMAGGGSHTRRTLPRTPPRAGANGARRVRVCTHVPEQDSQRHNQKARACSLEHVQVAHTGARAPGWGRAERVTGPTSTARRNAPARGAGKAHAAVPVGAWRTQARTHGWPVVAVVSQAPSVAEGAQGTRRAPGLPRGAVRARRALRVLQHRHVAELVGFAGRGGRGTSRGANTKQVNVCGKRGCSSR